MSEASASGICVLKRLLFSGHLLYREHFLSMRPRGDACGPMATVWSAPPDKLNQRMIASRDRAASLLAGRMRSDR
jgi:hypothetical protein